ncbi:MAG: hypothetical protein IPJ07_16920 [Acidobacteria bacterium]|nr:hypothetical protein [Acidobacteriota bacterium]
MSKFHHYCSSRGNALCSGKKLSGIVVDSCRHNGRSVRERQHRKPCNGRCGALWYECGAGVNSRNIWCKSCTQTLTATTATLPFSLDGTTVLINGLPAPIFFVSTGQVNVQIPPAVKPGVATVIVTNKNNLVSRGTLTITNTAPAIFTRLSNGTGAPAASASVDGQNFNLPMSNPDGSPIAIDAGNTVMLFGTSLRFNSGGAKVTLGGTDITPSFVGSQNQFIGLDQVNFQVPLSLAGRGDVDLTVTIDGRTSNVVKLKVK